VSTTNQYGQHAEGTVIRRIAALMIVEAATLAVASALHLSGSVHGRSAPFDPDRAGVAEAIIGAVLVAAAFVMFRAPARARTFGIAATGFAIAGFLLGLSFTARGGHLPDVAYHLTMLPVLIGGLIVLLRTGSKASTSWR
jgi:Na+-transporting NADH:ubiquinone oxidoreductase subunit NqrB